MLRKTLFLFFICVLSVDLLASQDYQIQSQQLKFDKVEVENDYNQIEQQQKEIQALLSRVELLEHKISVLEQQIKSANPSLPNNVSQGQTAVKPKSLQDSSDRNDVFDISTLSSDNNPRELIVKPSVAANNVEDDKKQYDLALAALKENKLQIAEEKFAEFLTKNPQSPLISNAYFWYGEVFFRRAIFDKATINYLKGYKHSPKGTKAADSLLKLAIALGELNKKQEACGVLAKLEAEFPSRPAASIKRAKDIKIKLGCN
ncbi:YbgF-like tol-pal system protein [Candidatus Trichorickettsia mobilis]|uniref:Cell division coordinator CpoB n=1 Tax=Candidatus Trichorickettsia mobilis TaxID=1346319 RepID=A0ABZ0UTD9_9RICK|nr:tol-pal system protein YbgF [Candidatus Trichorickettsia mobilis]WPY00357.1 YbgF-like tol-pal system protein [Candidatus Trichorickettsia mobilis]